MELAAVDAEIFPSARSSSVEAEKSCGTDPVPTAEDKAVNSDSEDDGDAIAPDLCGSLENWMGNLPQELRNYPIMYLAIPGTHDSFTYSINSRSPLAPDAEPILKKLSFLGCMLRCIMSRWSRTQKFHVESQLESGIRYFDLRIASKVGSPNLYFVHGQYSHEVGGILTAIEGFLAAHPREVVVLDCQHFYGFNEADHEKLIEMLMSIFKGKLTPCDSNMQRLTLDYMTTKFQYQVIVVYRRDQFAGNNTLLWPSRYFPSPWPNTICVSQLFTKLDAYLASRSYDCAFISQCILTPTPDFIGKNLYSTLKTKCVIAMDKQKYRWLRRQKPGKGGVNIVIGDFVELVDRKFCREVINLNQKLLSDFHNKS